ncbi:protein kinase domain-containing protein [Actinospica robiniae]|uniref:protein kinase domain-containing protein n=1 Tax=Actinospica robiniae TaxID=304901 RepID=UPI000405228D|nr:protein kinase [Actinospica robiniae]
MSDEVGAGLRLGSVYLLEERIGSGGMGTVWRGRNIESGEAIAVKMLADNLSQDRELVARFLQERAVLTGVHHPHLVEIRDLVAERDRLGLVLDLVQGTDANRLLQDSGPLGPAQVCRIGYEVCQALAAIHAAGIVHRDLKPANILLDARTGDARLADFGIALLAGSTRLTAVNSVVGTPHYLAPELLTGNDAGAAADVYALGICVYELLTGTVPFTGDHYAQILQQHINAEPQPHPAIPADMWPLIQRLLAKNPAHRPDTVTLGGWFFTLLSEFGGAGTVGPGVWPQGAVGSGSMPPAARVPSNTMMLGYTARAAGTPVDAAAYAAGGQSQPGISAWNNPQQLPPVAQPDPRAFDGSGSMPPLSMSQGPFTSLPTVKRGRGNRKLWITVSCVVAAAAVGTALVFATQGGSNPAAAGGGGASKSPSASASASATAVAAAGPLLDTWLMTGTAHDTVGHRDGVATDVKWTVLTDGTGSVGLHGVTGSEVLVDGPIVNTTQSFSIGVWVTMQGPTSTSSGWQTVVAQRGTKVEGAAIEYDPTANRWAFDMPQSDSDLASVDAVLSHSAPVKTTWYHIIATYDGRSHVMSLYVNRQLQGTSVHATDWLAGGKLSIGSGLADGGESNWLDGSLSDVQVWNKALSSDEVGGLG